jgi:hypothetical protein
VLALVAATPILEIAPKVLGERTDVGDEGERRTVRRRARIYIQPVEAAMRLWLPLTVVRTLASKVLAIPEPPPEKSSVVPARYILGHRHKESGTNRTSGGPTLISVSCQ